ncbi:hypothetical protein BJ912DRAFT_864668, partial [Pholiota molesta]
MTDTPTNATLRIWQQNVRKSWEAQLVTLHSAMENFDVICLQEPHFDFKRLSRVTPGWTSVYPSGYIWRVGGGEEEEQLPRAMTLIRSDLLTEGWTPVEVDSLDVVAVRLISAGGIINIYNVYNDCEHAHTL